MAATPSKSLAPTWEIKDRIKNPVSPPKGGVGGGLPSEGLGGGHFIKKCATQKRAIEMIV